MPQIISRFAGWPISDQILEINVFTPGGLWNICDMHGIDFTETIIAALEKKIEIRAGYRSAISNCQLATL